HHAAGLVDDVGGRTGSVAPAELDGGTVHQVQVAAADIHLSLAGIEIAQDEPLGCRGAEVDRSAADDEPAEVGRTRVAEDEVVGAGERAAGNRQDAGNRVLEVVAAGDGHGAEVRRAAGHVEIA